MNGMTDCLVINNEQNLTHPLDNVSFPARQMNNQTGRFEFSESFILTCNKIYSLGDSDVKLSPSLNTMSSRLCSIGIMTVRKVQGYSCTVPLRVLFDTGSDKMMFNLGALPKGTHASIVTRERVMGIYGTELLNQ